jgi:hypothetical protein
MTGHLSPAREMTNREVAPPGRNKPSVSSNFYQWTVEPEHTLKVCSAQELSLTDSFYFGLWWKREKK